MSPGHMAGHMHSCIAALTAGSKGSKGPHPKRMAHKADQSQWNRALTVGGTNDSIPFFVG